MERKRDSRQKQKLGEVFEQVQRDFPLMDITYDQHFRTSIGVCVCVCVCVFVRMQILQVVSKVMVC
jgi:hypothetical protein